MVTIKEAHAEAPLWNEESLKALARKKARKHGVNEKIMFSIIACESRWNYEIQSGHYYKPGNRWGFSSTTLEKSYGLSQIHIPDHESVTEEMAKDPNFALEFMAENLSKKRGKWMWKTCYNKAVNN